MVIHFQVLDINIYVYHTSLNMKNMKYKYFKNSCRIFKFWILYTVYILFLDKFQLKWCDFICDDLERKFRILSWNKQKNDKTWPFSVLKHFKLCTYIYIYMEKSYFSLHSFKDLLLKYILLHNSHFSAKRWAS